MTDYCITYMYGGYSEAAHREAVGRFVRFVQNERTLPFLRRWGPWLNTSNGKKTWFQLMGMADDFLCAVLSQRQYDHALLQLTAINGIPLEDCEIIARYAFEFCRCCFFGAGLVPVADKGPHENGVVL
jgi:hypothetical protein